MVSGNGLEAPLRYSSKGRPKIVFEVGKGCDMPKQFVDGRAACGEGGATLCTKALVGLEVEAPQLTVQRFYAPPAKQNPTDKTHRRAAGEKKMMT